MERTAIVTGGTGGLGAAVTRRQLDDGWRVVVPWFAERELERVDEHERLELVQADLTDPASAANVVATAGDGLRARRQPRRRVRDGRPASTRRRSTSSSSSCG